MSSGYTSVRCRTSSVQTFARRPQQIIARGDAPRSTLCSTSSEGELTSQSVSGLYGRVAATRPYNPDTDWLTRSPSELVERGVDLGASPRAIICWGRLAKVWALLQCGRTEVYPEDIQTLAPYILGHRIWLGPHAASHGLTTEAVIQDVIERVPIP